MSQSFMKRISDYEDSKILLNRPAELKDKAQNEGYLFFKGLLEKKTNISLMRDIIDVCSRHDFLDNDFDQNKRKVKSGLNIDPGSKEDKDYYKDVLKLRSMHSYAQSKEIMDLFELLFDGKVLNHSQNIVRTVFPDSKKFTTPPHQDYWYIGGNKNTWATWIPLGDTPQEMGTLAVGKSTHMNGIIQNRYRSDGAGNYSCDVDDNVEWVNGDMEAGDVLVFNCLSLHQATDNQTNKIRLSCDFRYQPVTEPVYITSLTPHLQLISWDEVYEEWDDSDDLKYYWEKYDLKINNEIEEDRRIN